MDLIEKFKTLTSNYDDSLFEIFKNIIDKTKEESIKQNIDSIKMFINVNKELKKTYIKLALATKIISSETEFNESHMNYIISENLLEKINDYMEPITKNARESIKEEAEKVRNSYFLEEMQEEYNNLMKILSDETINENDYVYKDIKFDRKKHY